MSVREIAAGETRLAHSAMAALRPQFADEAAFVALLDWLIEEARRSGCEQLHLDSGAVPERYDAHRLYMNTGLSITAHHFQRPL